jgi:hypothetical protein
MMSPYETTSGPPISNTSLLLSGRTSAAARYATTLSTAIGCVNVATHRGHTMTGSRSTSASIIWNDSRLDSGDGWERTRLIGQAAQIDDAPDTSASRRAAEGCSSMAIHRREIGPDRHGVHQVISRVHASEREVQRLLIEAIALHDVRR